MYTTNLQEGQKNMNKIHTKHFLIKGLLCFILINLTLGTANALVNDDDMRMLDFVIMSEGHKLKERDIYEVKVEAIAARYGMKIERKFDIKKFMTGEEALNKVVRVNVWQVPNGAMKSLGNDPDYKALVKFRNKIHNMDALSIFMANPDTIDGIATGIVMIDLVTMNPGFGLANRNTYEAKVAPITAKYGMSRFASYDITSKKIGIASDTAIRLNFWNIEDPEKMKLLSKDPAYQALLPFRNKIHNMERVTLFLAESIK